MDDRVVHYLTDTQTPAALVAATRAHAWVWDSHVRISGIANCYNGPYAAHSAGTQITIRLRPTGETRTVSINDWGFTRPTPTRFQSPAGWADEYVFCPFEGGWRADVGRQGVGEEDLTVRAETQLPNN